jgi:hypothetical protein
LGDSDCRKKKGGRLWADFEKKKKRAFVITGGLVYFLFCGNCPYYSDQAIPTAKENYGSRTARRSSFLGPVAFLSPKPTWPKDGEIPIAIINRWEPLSH